MSLSSEFEGHSVVIYAERTRLIDGSTVERRVRHRDEALMSFTCFAKADDSTPVNATWYAMSTN